MHEAFSITYQVDANVYEGIEFGTERVHVATGKEVDATRHKLCGDHRTGEF